MTATFRVLTTPVGPMTCAAFDGRLALLEFANEARLERQLAMLTRLFGPPRPGDDPIIDRTDAQLREYFAGDRKEFDLPLIIRGTPFQERVWHHLLTIQYGHTVAYADVAAALGVRNGQRAVGLANGQNRIAIVIPCHRVIERGGGLRGYGGGLANKKLLLDLERRHSDPLAGTPLGGSAGVLGEG